jgi:S-adenosylmethionine:tRNA ribosyltransferase-isomerase
MGDHTIEAYDYPLTEARIAKFPLEQRDASKLLCWRNGDISHRFFREVPELLPAQSLCVFNDTRVIPARLIFQKATGAIIEIFLLDPLLPSVEVEQAMQATSGCVWKCLIGNKKRWKNNEPLQLHEASEGVSSGLTAAYHDRERDLIQFTWTGDKKFVEVVDAAGHTPLPPYLHRQVAESDKLRYQTIYSRHQGAVAAPTAGLHFTEPVLQEMERKGIQRDFVTLHVGAGTFRPVQVSEYTQHHMHSEQVVLTKALVDKLSQFRERVIAVGTTSMRTLESAYWYGVQLLTGGNSRFVIDKLQPYAIPPESLPSRMEAFLAIAAFMEQQGLEKLGGSTEIFIYPGYDFRVVDGLITNFHLPKSTLLLLIAAFTRGDWRRIYDEALAADYRFLSYGDSSLLLR